MNSNKYWPWAITGVFLVFCSFIVIFAIFAKSYKVELVAPNYYEKEIKYQETIDQENQYISWNNKFKIQQNVGELILQLENPISDFIIGDVVFYKPNNKSSDRTYPIVLDEAGKMSISKSDLEKGNAQIEIDFEYEGKLMRYATTIQID